MAKKYDNDAKTIEGKILSCLLEGSKTNTQLLEELEYDINRHGNISRPLKSLSKKNLEREPLIGYKSVKSEKIDDFCKLWSIIPSYRNFKRILNDYSYLFLKMHKNDMVLDSVLKVAQSSEKISDPTQGIPVKHIYRMPEEIKRDIKEKMGLSPEFFRRHFSNSISQENQRELAELVEELESKSADAENGNFDNISKSHNNIETVFKVCVYYDIMNGESSKEAKDYLINKKKKRFQINSLEIISSTTHSFNEKSMD